MMYLVNDNVLYKNMGICTVVDIEKKSFDGLEDTEYYKLKPINSASSTYYVPVPKSDEFLRNLLSKEEVLELIDSMPSEESSWCADNKERKLAFNKILKSDDYKAIIGMINSIYNHQQEIKSNGKKISASDEYLMISAENMMYEEFSVVLNIALDDVKDFILNRIGEK